MVRRILGVMATVVLLNAGVGPVGANEEAIAQARTAANAWFALLDAHEFDESWETAGELLAELAVKSVPHLRMLHSSLLLMRSHLMAGSNA